MRRKHVLESCTVVSLRLDNQSLPFNFGSVFDIEVKRVEEDGDAPKPPWSLCFPSSVCRCSAPVETGRSCFFSWSIQSGGLHFCLPRLRQQPRRIVAEEEEDEEWEDNEEERRLFF